MSEERDSLRAAETVAKSRRWQAVAAWVVTVVVLPCAGWVTAKLDTKLEVDGLAADVRKLSGDIAVLTSQQQTLGKQIADLSSENVDSPGPIFLLRREQRYAGRNIVRAVGMALAGEGSRQARKRAAGEQLAAVFDNRVKDMRASEAMQEVIATIAVPP